MRIFSPLLFKILPLLIASLILAPATGLAQDTTLSAYEFVQQWNQTYGLDHQRAAAMTTKQYRSGQSEEAWVETFGPFLDYVKYKHLGGELISEHTEAHKARIVLKSTVDSVNGPVAQHEIYDLVKIDGTWLVDYIDIKDEEFNPVIGTEQTQQLEAKKEEPSSNHSPTH